MAKHYIIMSSSYIDGARVALDITDGSKLNDTAISEIISIIKQSCGEDVPLSTHFVETESDTWDSVSEYDPFFKDVVLVTSVSEFSDKVKKSRRLTGLDVANYILSTIRCTHLSLEKLVYFAYADYLCAHKAKDRLFEDRIYAFTHGPVIESVYETYKKSGYQYVKPLESVKDSIIKTDVNELPARSRILFAANGADKLRSINQTIKKYSHLSAGALVDLTHREGTPWHRVDSTKQYEVIPDDLILEYHYIECV